MIGTSGIVNGQAWIGVDGLIAIARANGLVDYSREIVGDVCAVVLFVGEIDYAYTYTMEDVRADGSGNSYMWKCHFYQMFKAWSLGKAIRTHFKDAVEAAEKELAQYGDLRRA